MNVDKRRDGIAALRAAGAALLGAALLAVSGCVVAPFRATHALRPLTGHHYPDLPPGSPAFERGLDAYTRSEAWTDNRVAFLAEPAESGPALAYLTEKTAVRLTVALTVRGNDPALERFWTAAAAAAGRGVEVRVLLDAERQAPGPLPGLEALAAAGAEILWLNPEWLTRLRLRCDNRAVFSAAVFDGQYALLGGLPGAEPMPALLVAGSAATALEHACARMWSHARRPAFSRLMPLALVRAAARVVNPRAVLKGVLGRKAFEPPPYLVPLLEDDRFEQAAAAALAGHFAGASGADADAARADAQAAVLWAANDIPPPDPEEVAAPATASSGAAAFDAAAPAAGLVRQWLALAASLSVAWPEPAGANVTATATLSSGPAAPTASLPSPSSRPPAPAAEAPEEASGGATLLGEATERLGPLVRSSMAGAAFTLAPPALLAAQIVDIGMGMARERRRVHVRRPEDTRAVPPEEVPAVEGGAGRAARWARHAREGLGLSPARVSVRVVPTRPDARTSGGFDLALLGAHAAARSIALAGAAAGGAPPELRRALRAAANRNVAVDRRAPAAGGAWMVADGRLTTVTPASWRRSDFFLAYSLALAVDDPTLAAAVRRWAERAPAAAE